jgi:hypothetical protein
MKIPITSFSEGMTGRAERDRRRARLLTDQTSRDHVEMARRIAGREAEVERLMNILAEIIPCQQRKDTLVRLAKQLATQNRIDLLPRLESRNLALMVLWFADHFPELFAAKSINEFLSEPINVTVDKVGLHDGEHADDQTSDWEEGELKFEDPTDDLWPRECDSDLWMSEFDPSYDW